MAAKFMFIVVGCFVTIHPAYSQIISAFDDNYEGWTISGNGSSEVPDYYQDDGNPGGYIEDVDASDGAFYFVAPEKYLGNQSKYYGSELCFDLKAVDVSGKYARYDDVFMIGDGLTLAFYLDIRPSTEWQTHTIGLYEAAGWTNKKTKKMASREDMMRVLFNLERLEIRAEYYTGHSEKYGLDNVILGAASTVDAEKIYFISDRTGTKSIWSVSPEGREPSFVLGFNDRNIGTVRAKPTEGLLLFSTQALSGSDSQNALWLAELNGSNVRQVPIQGQLPHEGFSWAEDGRTIVYPTVWDGIYRIDPDGSNQRRLTTHYMDDEPDVSVHNTIVYVNHTRREIHVMDMNGLNNTLIYSQANIDWPRWSPDGSQILYAVYNSGLWIIDSDGSNPRLVVAELEGEDLRHPAWSPDGSRIIFTRRIDNNDDIWIVDIGTSAEAHLVDHSARDIRPEWATIILPDQNDCIIFSYKAEETDHYDLWMIRPDGSDLKNITNTVDWDEHSPAIHSQSGQIGYIIQGSASFSDEGLFVVGVGESTPLPIALRSDFDGLEIASPVWIDANNLVFTVGRDGDRALYHADIPSLQVQQICSMADALGDQAKEGFVTDVSPDGLQLIVCAERGNWTPTYDLYLMNSNGTEGELLYGDNPDKYIDGIAKWSPDSQTIAFTHDYTGGAYQDTRYLGIVSMNPIIPGTVGLDGITELYELTSRSEFALLQDWSPDGTKLLFFAANHYGFNQDMTDLRGNLWLMDRDGNNARPLTSLDGWFRSIESYVSLACWGQLEDSKSFDRD